MADTPITLAGWAAYAGTHPMAKRVINTFIAQRPLLGEVPIVNWPGGEDFSWVLNSTLPTITWEAESAAHYSSTGTRRKLKTSPAYAHGDVEIPIFSSAAINDPLIMEAQQVMDLVRAMGVSMSGKLFTGAWMTEANVTINGSGIAATPGIDVVVAVSNNWPSGAADVSYTHAGTLLKIKAPGSSTFGVGVSIAGGDGNYTLYDGDDTTQYVTLTIDASDYTTGAVNLLHNGALTFQRPEDVAGLLGIAALDSNQVKTPSTNGDAATLAHLDELEEMCLGPKEEKVLLVNPRTRIALKHLLAGAGGTQPQIYRGRDLSKYDLVYEGVPILAESNIGKAETQGGSGAICTRMYCVRLNQDVGFHMFAVRNMQGPNFGTMPAISDHDSEMGPVPLPVYLRKLGEATTTQTYKWRIGAGIATVLRNSQSCSMRYGVTT